MRKALLQKRPRESQAAVSQSLPVPTGGLNTRDALSAMPAGDLILATNCIVKPAEIVVRPGWLPWAEGLSPVSSLLPYNPPTATGSKLFAGTNAGIYDVSTEASPSLEATPVSTRGQWVSVNFPNASGHRLFAVNGQDSMIVYNGSAWSITSALGSVNTTELNYIAVHKQRLFFLRNDSSSFWYLATGSITGTLNEFSLGQVCRRGGSLLMAVTWTIDGGDGTDDRLVFITSEGEAIVCAGTDPASVNSWSIQGVYYIGKPMNNRCAVKFGGDLLVLTELGVVPLSRVLKEGVTNPQIALSYKIAPTLQDMIERLRAQDGWDMLIVPGYPLLIVNVPENPSQQLCYHFESGAWSLFRGITSYCWAHWDGDTYFGSDGGVMHWGPAGDDGAAIEMRLMLSYNYFGDPTTTKHVALVRPVFGADGNFTYTLGAAVDFERTPLTFQATTTALALTQWDSALWDTGVWLEDFIAFREWRTLRNHPGRAFSLYISTEEEGVRTALTGMDYIVQAGGML